MKKEEKDFELVRRVITNRHGSQEKKLYAHEPTEKQKERLKRLEGQCKITQFTLLKINYPKAIFFAIIMTLSIVGLLLLKYYKKLRSLLFYGEISIENLSEATHIYVQGTDNIEEISTISKEIFNNEQKFVFTFKHLKYQINQKECLPVGMHYLDTIGQYLSHKYLQNGLKSNEVAERGSFFGRNEHLVEVPNYFQYLFDVMTKPFFIFQYFVCLIWILEGVMVFGVLMVVFAYITTTINYILLYRSYGQIKQTAEKVFTVQVLRNGSFITIANTALVPGDLYIPTEEIPCDSLIMKGELFVDQVSLTGQNVPISKTFLIQTSQILQSSHWVFEGSKLETMKENTLAMAVHVGFGSRRGRIIRKILNKIPKQPQYFTKLLVFLFEVFLVSAILYAATVSLMFDLQIETIMIVIRFLDFITYSFPAPYPIYFNLAYSFCLVRLHRKGIIGTESQKTIQSSRLKTLCFDKTGTLTQNKMSVSNVYAINGDNEINEITQKLAENNLITDVFATCHSVQQVNGQIKGDQIDLRMFEFTQGRIEANESTDILRNIVVSGRKLEILKINQYESRFQSMSVMFKVSEVNRYFIGVKGSPQKIHDYSKLKYKDFDSFIKKLSLTGFRSIAFGFKEINANEIKKYMVAQREDFLSNTTILGVVAFVNKLKGDAFNTIETLTSCNINTKIITGDNIFLGVKTAIMTGMIGQNDNIIIVQGKNYKSQNNSVEVIELQQNQGKIIEKHYNIQSFQFQDVQRTLYAIDNEFLEKNQHFLHKKVKVFARITPQNKAVIIRKHTQLEKQKIQRRTCFQSLFGEASLKVGMVGDGANDLIAIKQANVGIGISSSDAVYSASFAVQNLADIITIVKQSKNVERQIMDMVQYFSIINFLSIISTLLQNGDASYYTSQQLLYRNFALILLMTLFMGLSVCLPTLSRYMPASNFMGLQHHLVFWGNCIIFSGGLILGYFLFYNSSAFVPNPQPVVTFSSGYNGQNMSSTLMFLLTTMAYLLIPPFIHRGSPWKEPFYKNLPMLILFILNLIALIPIFMMTQKMGWLTLVEIERKWAGIELGIIIVTSIIAGIYSKIIQSLALHEREEMEIDIQSNSSKFS